MAHRDPHLVLGIEPGAPPDEIKTAWRTLARRHHPDLTGDDPEAARRATRRMAEINAAYAALTKAGETPEGIRRRRAEGGEDPDRSSSRGPRPGAGPPPEPVTRPVTGRVDTSSTFRPRNHVTTPPGVRMPLAGQPPLRPDRPGPDLRASRPSSPAERIVDPARALREPPTLGEAAGVEIGFGKFHGHTLGEIAAFEPSYIDWLAGTMTRDPDVAAAARVIAQELDRRGIRRTAGRPQRPGWQSNPFR